MTTTALVQVLGAVAYGERKAAEGARAKAAGATTEHERQVWEAIAAEERRHYHGFVRRLRALGADPERAMRPYRRALDHFHALPEPPDEVEAAVMDLLGEGIAADLLRWLRRVADPGTASFVDTVLADEAGHEARAAAAVRRLVAARPDGRRRAAAAGRRMLARMVESGPGSLPSFTAFVRAGDAAGLLGTLAGGYARRLHAIGVGPLSALERLDPSGLLARLDPWAPREQGEAA